MSLKIVSQERPRELPDDAADELIRRLSAGGIIERDLESGEAISRSPMAELAERLTVARDSADVYSPAEDEQGILFVVVDTWLADVNVNNFPVPAQELRYDLFRDIDDRRRSHSIAASS